MSAAPYDAQTDAAAKACPRCKGRGTVSEDPMPDCPSVAYPAEECPACGGSGEATEHEDAPALCPCGERPAGIGGVCDECRADAHDPVEP